jgi:hypothetical protein
MLRSSNEYNSKRVARTGMGARLWFRDEARMSIHCLMEPTSEVAMALKATSLTSGDFYH